VYFIVTCSTFPPIRDWSVPYLLLLVFRHLWRDFFSCSAFPLSNLHSQGQSSGKLVFFVYPYFCNPLFRGSNTRCVRGCPLPIFLHAFRAFCFFLFVFQRECHKTWSRSSRLSDPPLPKNPSMEHSRNHPMNPCHSYGHGQGPFSHTPIWYFCDVVVGPPFFVTDNFQILDFFFFFFFLLFLFGAFRFTLNIL